MSATCESPKQTDPRPSICNATRSLAAGDRRRPPLRGPRIRPQRRPARPRRLPQGAPRRRHPGRLETRPARAQPPPPRQHRPRPDRPRRRAQGPHRARRGHRHHDRRRQARLRDLRRPGRVRTRTDLRTHHRRAGLGPRPRPQRRPALQDDAGQAPPRRGLDGQPDTKVGDLCTELGVTRQTLYRHVSPTGELRPDGRRLLADSGRKPG